MSLSGFVSLEAQHRWNTPSLVLSRSGWQANEVKLYKKSLGGRTLSSMP